MRFYIAVTDNDWYSFLAARSPDEVNFWQPSGRYAFRAIEQYAPFLFKLHSPRNFIVGGGFFVSHSILPLSLAWASFGEKNGAPDEETCRIRIRKYRSRNDPRPSFAKAAEGKLATSTFAKATVAKRDSGLLDPMIGCIILTQPFFFPESDWIPAPADWSPNIVQGKTYDTEDFIGRRLWEQVQERLAWMNLETAAVTAEPARAGMVAEARYSWQYLARRLGQGAFRVLVTDAYQRRCAITGERTLPVLEAAHIKPFAQEGPHEVRNGLLLKEDFHTLFDKGYLTVTPEYRVEVSKRI
ncbi:MAG: HNH endonuclease, partial [Bacteroidota bacterium]